MSWLEEALKQARDTECVPQRGNTCFGYGGIQCDEGCSAFQEGIKRRQKARQDFLANRIMKTRLPNGCTLRVSTQGDTILLEVGEYVDDGNTPIMFTVFDRNSIPRVIFDMLRLTSIE